MAICPMCALPNPESADACIWCGRHRFAAPEAVLERAAVAASIPTASPKSHYESPTVVAMTPGPIASSMQTTNSSSIQTTSSLVAEHKPLPPHVQLLLTPAPISAVCEPRTVAVTPTTAPAQASIATPPPSDTPAPPLQAKLIVIRGQKINHDYPLYEGRNVIGRFADRPVDIDLVFQEAEGQIWSSRQHAAIIFDKNHLFVEDLNSLNGTWLNGARLSAGQKRPLKANDVIQIGTVQLKLAIA